MKVLTAQPLLLSAVLNLVVCSNFTGPGSGLGNAPAACTVNPDSDSYTCDYCTAGSAGSGSMCTNANTSDSCLIFQPCDHGTCNATNTVWDTCDCSTGQDESEMCGNTSHCVRNPCDDSSCLLGPPSCICDPGYTGIRCDEIDHCESVDCNNGICIDLADDYMCDCYADYTGQNCSEIINDCASSPCSALGTLQCMDGNMTFTCKCAAGFIGKNCFELDACHLKPCENGGTCTNEQHGTFSCVCPPEWTGNACSHDATPCDPNPCTNDGTCIDAGTSFLCSCVPGWTGAICSKRSEVNTCPFQEKVPLFDGSETLYDWAETGPGQTQSHNCPDICSDFTVVGGMVMRTCQLADSEAIWQQVDFSGCGVSSMALQLCEASQV